MQEGLPGARVVPGSLLVDRQLLSPGWEQPGLMGGMVSFSVCCDHESGAFCPEIATDVNEKYQSESLSASATG